MSRVNNKSSKICNSPPHIGVNLPYGYSCACITVEGLQGIARHRGLPVSGNKATLCHRITGKPCNCAGKKGSYRRASKSVKSKPKPKKEESFLEFLFG